jgi:hypothetical protein
LATRALILLLFFCGAAEAQTTAGDEIRKVVKPGQRLGVTDQGGQEVKGRVVDLGPDSFAIETRGQRRELRYADTVRIDRVDSLRNGALIGLIVGSGLGLAVVSDTSCDPVAIGCGHPGPGNYIATALVAGGLGAAVGTGIDALIGGTRTIYRRGGHVQVSPALHRTAAGAVVTVSW